MSTGSTSHTISLKQLRSRSFLEQVWKQWEPTTPFTFYLTEPAKKLFENIHNLINTITETLQMKERKRKKSPIKIDAFKRNLVWIAFPRRLVWQNFNNQTDDWLVFGIRRAWCTTGTARHRNQSCLYCYIYPSTAINGRVVKAARIVGSGKHCRQGLQQADF